MDRHLIAPGPDLRWHVSARLDRRIPDLRALAWRVEQLGSQAG